MMLLSLLLLLTLQAATAVPADDPWASALDPLMQRAVDDKAWPGAVAAVFDEHTVYYKRAVGRFTYGVPPPETPDRVPAMRLDTVFDMASCTKVLATTTAVAALYDARLLDLDAPIAAYLPEFSARGKKDITVRHALLHNSGLKADPVPGYSSATFGCPETGKPSPQLSFSCRNRCYDALMGDAPTHAPGQAYEYSDENFMALMNVVGLLVRQHSLVSQSELRADCVAAGGDGVLQCYYEAYARKLLARLGASTTTGFLPARSLWPRIAPTENTTSSAYRKRCVQGEVHDENTFAMGGVSGHAGLFATLDDVVVLMRAWLFPERAAGVFSAATAKLFVTQSNHSQSSRALGWNTNADDAEDHGFSYACGTLSPSTFMHTGFTGPVVCADPVRKVATVLLCNRVYPDRNSASKWISARRGFNTLVQKVWDTQKQH